jgi:hypothetical protein
MATERQPSGATNEGAAGVNDRANAPGQVAAAGIQPSKMSTTTTTVTTTTTTKKTTNNTDATLAGLRATTDGSEQEDGGEVATVQELGRQASAARAPVGGSGGLSSQSSLRAELADERQRQQQQQQQQPLRDEPEWKPQVDPAELQQAGAIEGNRFVTSIGTVAAQSSQSRIVVAILKDGSKFQLKVQEMRPAIFEVGANPQDCRKYIAEHRTLLANLAKHKQAPIEAWLAKYKRLQQARPGMSAEWRLVYMCMAENLQGCWRALLMQLEQRLQLLEETSKFYDSAELLLKAIERADSHVQAFRRAFLDGPGSVHYSQAANELRQLNRAILDEYGRARGQQRRLVELIAKMATSNLADSRPNLLIGDAQNLIDFINGYIEPLERRKIQLENVISSSSSNVTTSTTTITKSTIGGVTSSNMNANSTLTTSTMGQNDQTGGTRANGPRRQSGQTPASSGPFIREIGNFNDLRLVENWLATKMDQLNSSLLSSLGASAPDSRSVLNKHEQIALELSAIEEALQMFRGKSIHAPRPEVVSAGEKGTADGGEPSGGGGGQPAVGQQTAAPPPPPTADSQAGLLLEQQRQLAARVRDVMTVLDARIALLRRTIDFYSRARGATTDINKMMRRLQADNSLQSVQFVADELELKDVSSVVASGATIISELQQLQLAQQHGQRSKEIGLQLETAGIRAAIDRLNQELAHLKTVLNQRRLVLLNEDAGKMAQNFANKCQQLKFWLENHAKSFLLSNNRIGVETRAVRSFCDQHEELQLALQQKTLEVEALLRLLSSLTESFDAKSQTADEIQRDTDELRQDWINVTNCLERRLELARKYLLILTSVGELKADIGALEAGPAQQDDAAGTTRPRTPDERTHEDIEAHVGQSLVQLANQVRNFTQDAQRTNTSLVYAPALESKAAVNDINKQQIVGHANGSVRLLEEQLKATLNRIKARGPRKWPTEEGGGQPRQRPAGARRRDDQPVAAAPQPPPQRQARSDEGPPPAPRFVRHLTDAEVEPFSRITLECELEPVHGQQQQPVRVEWLLNNKRIPNNIKHSASSEGNRHRLTIGQFGPMCCGTYTARATNQFGETATSSCRLRLVGIREVESPSGAGGQFDELAHSGAGQLRPDGQQQQQRANSNTLQQQQQQQQQQQVSNEQALGRIIQGVESPISQDGRASSEQAFVSAKPAPRPSGQQQQQQMSGAPASWRRTSTTTTTTATAIGGTKSGPPPPTDGQQLQVNRLSYDGSQQTDARQQRFITFIDSPTASSLQSRSVSRSPFEGTPQPPVFMEPLTSEQRGASQAGLVCVVIGNPPPSVEWLHEGRPIASARCARPTAGSRASLCKLTIETLNDRTLGQYVCRASNRLGQSSTALTLGQ